MIKKSFKSFNVALKGSIVLTGVNFVALLVHFLLLYVVGFGYYYATHYLVASYGALFSALLVFFGVIIHFATNRRTFLRALVCFLIVFVINALMMTLFSPLSPLG